MLNSMGPSVLIIEDDSDIAEMITEVLTDEGYQVAWAATGETGLELGLNNRYEVLIVDRRLPGIDGVEVIRRIRNAQKTTPCLMLTALDTIDDRVSGLDGGANDYLTKPFDFAELLARLRALLRGYKALGNRRYIGEWLFTPENATLFSPYGSRISLTQTEAALLGLLCESPDHVFSREEILASVFTKEDTLGTVDTYVHYIRRKSDPELIETVRGQGYRLGDAA